MTVDSIKPVLLRVFEAGEGCQLLDAAWYGGKNNDQLKRPLFSAFGDAEPFVLADFPLHLVKANEAGVLYDGTANLDRVKAYAKLKIDTPVYLLFGKRTAQSGAAFANVMDGGHRVSAARMRGDSTIKAIMKQSHFDALSRLLEARALEIRASRAVLARLCADQVKSSQPLQP